MRQTTGLLLAALALAACSEGASPGKDLATGPLSLSIGTIGPCDFKAAQNLARAYFATAQRKTASDLIRAMEQAGAGTATANTNGFAVFQLIASTRDNHLEAGTALNGADLTIALINCMDVKVTETRSLRQILTGALDYGAYAYRQDSEGPVMAENGVTGVYPVGGNFAAWIGGRALLYSASVPAVFTETVVVGAFRWGMVYDATTAGPNPANDDAVTVAICPSLAGVSDASAHRIGRNHATGETVLQLDLSGLPWFPCPSTTALQPSSGVLSRVLAFFAPKRLYARVRTPGGTGGLADGFSDFAVVDAATVNLSYLTQPVDGFVKAPITVAVKAVAAHGTPLENVAITLSVFGNQGQPVQLTGAGPVFTGEDGVATFSITLNKTGGYRLAATSAFTGFATVTIVSNLFNLQQ
ncbi:MAG TPA: hypothetical protein VGP61_04105 [Gemmatimonadales bacterium]|nr:hypothetical protein [Gemmatimonadales bacterium]